MGQTGVLSGARLAACVWVGRDVGMLAHASRMGMVQPCGPRGASGDGRVVFCHGDLVRCEGRPWARLRESV